MAHPDACRVVLIGCGAVSQHYYAPALQRLAATGEVRVVGLFDPNTDALGRLATAFPRAARLDDLQQIAKLDAELAIVASPPRFHAEQTLFALRAGLAVLCEKPMATTVAEAEAMIAAADQAGRVLAVGLVRRFFPAAQTIRSILTSGALGRPLSFQWFDGGQFRWPVVSPDYFSKTTSPGGVLMDIGVHVLDLVLWWFGEPLDTHYEDDAMGGVEANCRIRIQFGGGNAGDIRLSRDWSRPNQFLCHGTNGWLRWRTDEVAAVELGFADAPFHVHGVLRPGPTATDSPGGIPAADFDQSFVAQIRDVITATRAGQNPIVSGQVALRSLGLIEHCYRNRTLMPMPWLEERERQHAQVLFSRS